MALRFLPTPMPGGGTPQPQPPLPMWRKQPDGSWLIDRGPLRPVYQSSEATRASWARRRGLSGGAE